jgi:hypothetical protein
MQDLVLLSEEVALLKQAALQSVAMRTRNALGCEFLCEQGLVERRDERLRLTAIGHRVARKLIADSATGTVWLQRSQMEVLGWRETIQEAVVG